MEHKKEFWAYGDENPPVRFFKQVKIKYSTGKETEMVRGVTVYKNGTYGHMSEGSSWSSGSSTTFDKLQYRKDGKTITYKHKKDQKALPKYWLKVDLSKYKKPKLEWAKGYTKDQWKKWLYHNGKQYRKGN